MKALLVLNAGSSSVKFAWFDAGPDPRRRVHGQVDGLRSTPRIRIRAEDATVLADEALASGGDGAPPGHDRALAAVLDWLAEHRGGDELVAVGHRIVHGGTRFAGPVRVTPDVLADLEALTPLAPLHQPHNLDAVRTVSERFPELPQVACFDTGFHASQPWLAQAFALPRDLSERGIRRYGFHGLSYEYVAGVLPQHLGALADGRVVVAHLGSGASLCAMHGRASVATTMGFTAIDGLMMGTRCGSLDPGVVLHLIAGLGMTVDEVQTVLNERSGLLGVSGLSADLRVLEASPDPRARDAIALFSYRIGRELGSLAAALGGLDALVFTAGIGEHSARVREQVCRHGSWLGIDLDPAANRAGAARISAPQSAVAVCVIPTDEESTIARHTRLLLDGPAASPASG